jgi:anti-anti-sigma factor
LEYFENEIIEDIAIESVKMVRITFIEAKLFWERLQTSIIPEYNKVIVDISKCKFIDSAFMGVLVRIHRMLLAEKGELKLVLDSKQIERYFRFAGLNKIIDTNISLEEAINSFKKKDKVGDMVVS